MIITTAYLLTATYSVFRLGDQQSRTGFVEFKNDTEFIPVQVSNDSQLLCEENLKHICTRSGFSGYPLYKLTQRDGSYENVYEVDNCASCYDLYLECNDFPFRIDQSGDVRLFFEFKWTAFCQDPSISLEEASKFCLRNAMPEGNVSLIPGSFGQYNQSWIIRRRGTSGFSSCDRSELQSNVCHPGNLLAIRCGGLPKLRLISDSEDDQRGRIEVRINTNEWVPLSAEDLTLNDAKVLCSSLGYPSDNSNYKKRKFTIGQKCNEGPLSCNGNETTLVDCPGYSESVSERCSYIAEISCSNASEGDLRLTGGFDNVSGRLEIYHLNRWGSVCNYHFGEREMSVACNQITQGKTTKGQKLYHIETLPSPLLSEIWLDGVTCDLDDDTLSDCAGGQWGGRYCRLYKVVYLSCAETPKFRLYGGESRYVGRLEVFHDNQWGTICNKNFGSNEARTACRTLGMPSTTAYVVSGMASGPFNRIWLDRLDCDSDNLTNCRDWKWGVIDNSCSHQRDVELSCNFLPDVSSLNHRLVGAGADNIGVLEIAYNNQWGTVCRVRSSNATAQVVCRSLGLPWTNARMFDRNSFSVNSSKIWMFISSCRGSEENLLQCSSPRFGSISNYCYSYNRLAVSCGTASPNDYSVRLVNNKNNKNAGRLEVQINGIWGTVCSEMVFTVVARVVCRQLGLSSVYARKANIDTYGRGTGMIWLQRLDCNGDEKSLASCPTKRIGPGSCHHGQDLAISCDEEDRGDGTASPSDYSVRLVNIKNNKDAGRLEVHISGIWGTVCNEKVSPGVPRVVCRQLGLSTVYAGKLNNNTYEKGPGMIWLHEIYCNGDEQSLASCPTKRIGPGSCHHGQDLAISCDEEDGGGGTAESEGGYPGRSALIGGVTSALIVASLIIFVPVLCIVFRRRRKAATTRGDLQTGFDSTCAVSNTNIVSQETSRVPPPNPAVLSEIHAPPCYLELFPDKRPPPGIYFECSG